MVDGSRDNVQLILDEWLHSGFRNEKYCLKSDKAPVTNHPSLQCLGLRSEYEKLVNLFTHKSSTMLYSDKNNHNNLLFTHSF